MMDSLFGDGDGGGLIPGGIHVIAAATAIVCTGVVKRRGGGDGVGSSGDVWEGFGGGGASLVKPTTDGLLVCIDIDVT